MDLLEQSLEAVIIVGAHRLAIEPRLERPAKGGGNPGLIGDIINLDDLAVHGRDAFDFRFEFN